jgi:hypothetical protein
MGHALAGPSVCPGVQMITLICDGRLGSALTLRHPVI